MTLCAAVAERPALNNPSSRGELPLSSSELKLILVIFLCDSLDPGGKLPVEHHQVVRESDPLSGWDLLLHFVISYLT